MQQRACCQESLNKIFTTWPFIESLLVPAITMNLSLGFKIQSNF